MRSVGLLFALVSVLLTYRSVDAASPPPGDFNADGQLTSNDINMLLRVVARSGSWFDLDRSGTVESADLEWLVQEGIWTWMGDGNNVCASFLHGAGQFGFDLTFSGPETLDPEPDAIAFARENGASVTIERDAAAAVAGADLVVADTWVSMHDAPSTRERRHNLLRGYQVDEALMARAKPDALFMHCLPAHREEEVTSAVMDGPHSVIFDEAENRLHAQKAVMRWCLGV